MERKIVIHLFVYEGDAALITENLRCCRNAVPEAKLVVIDDGNNPCPPEVRKEAEAFGAEWRVSAWSRGGNLRGRACIEGILSELLASSSREDDILMKIDADTCLLDGASLKNFAAGEKVIWASGCPDERIYGCAYALKAHAVQKVLDYVKTLELSDHAPEDIIIGFSTIDIFPDSALHDITRPLSQEPGVAKWAAYNWVLYPEVRPAYMDYTVVTTGNKPKPPLHKRHRLPVMRALRKAYEERNQSATPQTWGQNDHNMKK